ncbi:hypothetical protein M501DRAFT_1006905 [Patellaria atrata CBS 101060]|uniref:Sld7 C-terminal domain-containing protein n=1 Tax=Patellaria atrata CBS 101060 TaxID=1346257 RepID=A0A9P4S6C6_9PEZI|nr:hypothetical protein M501DRAFT_1006905 [Patellaria atrata CBS 101060]
MDVWTGSLSLPNDQLLKGLHFPYVHISSSGSTSPPSNLNVLVNEFKFISLVATAQIPLCLAAGPSRDVWTACKETETWFGDTLLAEPGDEVVEPGPEGAEKLSWWQAGCRQSPVGALVAVVQKDGQAASWPKITEILFYGTLEGPAEEGKEVKLEIRALPLSSDLLTQGLPPTPPLSPGREKRRKAGEEVEARFLPTPWEVQDAASKRKAVTDVFDQATELRRKAKRKGGEGIAAAASKADGATAGSAHRRSLSIGGKLSSAASEDRSGPQGPLSVPISTRPLSRSPSISLDSRPTSRKGHLDKRSSLSRVTSIANANEGSTVESKNKETISRLVMAGMRLYGLQQRKKTNHNRKDSNVGPVGVKSLDEYTTDDAPKDEEYKLIYHQVFKGTVFTFRRNITTTPLNQHTGRLQDTVDKLLALYCTDPMVDPLVADSGLDGLVTPGSTKLFGALVKAVEKSPFTPLDRGDPMEEVRVLTPVIRRGGSSG